MQHETRIFAQVTHEHGARSATCGAPAALRFDRRFLMVTVPTDIAALILFLARERIDPDEYDRARALCAKVDDWALVSTIAMRKFIMPMVYDHFFLIRPDSLSAAVLQDMKEKALACSMKSLRIASAQASFHRLCIVPSECEHIYLKGVGLAARYYHNPGMRYSRDVDVLVSADAIERVVRKALKNGYRIKIRADELTTEPCELALRTMLKYEQIFTMLSPESIWIEVHTHVDYGLGLFNPAVLLDKAVPFDGTAAGQCVPDTTVLFSYCCYHSARHTWSRLHWLADINAMMDDPSFDLEGVLDFAARIGLEPIVRATLKFQKLAATANWVQDRGRVDPHADAILSHCIANLADDFKTEMGFRARFNYLGLPCSWMLSKDARWLAYARRTVGGITPSYYLYESIPLPEYLHWLYYPVKPFFVFWHRVVLRKA